MGRKKSRKKPPPKKKMPPMPNLFDCPFCLNSGSIECQMNQQLARIQCRICDEKWSTSNVTELTANVDVYNEWIDCCEAENQAELNREEEEENINDFVV